MKSLIHAEKSKERLWAEIDLEALRFNFHQVKRLLKSATRVLAVVKADAYGHGAVMCAKTLLAAGADYLGVATVGEALELRNAGISAAILILGPTSPDEADTLVRYDITPAVFSLEFAEALSAAAVRQKKQARLHLKLNTGMERIGFDPQAIDEMLSVCRLPGLFAEGIFTHLACADAADSSGVHTQYKRFIHAAEQLKEAGIAIPIRHILNSAGIFDFPEYQLEMVRPGIVLYGYYPSDYIQKERAELRPVLSLKTRVCHLHRIKKGHGVSYGWTYQPKEDILAATLPVGYADGYSRHLSNCGKMLAGSQTVPIIGKICMDQCMIDVTSVHTIHIGDEITVIGRTGEATVTADDLAKLADTISYEILCAIGKRVPRLYMDGGEVVGVLNVFA